MEKVVAKVVILVLTIVNCVRTFYFQVFKKKKSKPTQPPPPPVEEEEEEEEEGSGEEEEGSAAETEAPAVPLSAREQLLKELGSSTDDDELHD